MVLAHRRRHLFLGEPYAQLRKVGRPIYINHPDSRQSSPLRGADPPTISQPASKPGHFHQRARSLTGNERLDGHAHVGAVPAPLVPGGTVG